MVTMDGLLKMGFSPDRAKNIMNEYEAARTDGKAPAAGADPRHTKAASKEQAREQEALYD